MAQNKTKPTLIFVVDDHEVARLGLRTLLEGHPYLQIVGESDSYAKAQLEIERSRPDIVLLDVRLPDGNGIDICRAIKKSIPDIRVLILTAYAEDAVIYEAILAGADGYLLKEVRGQALVSAIEKVAVGQSILDPALTQRVFSRIKSLSESKNTDKFNLLSSQEKRVLALVAEGKTNKEIATEMGLSDKTVKNYLSNALDKLELSRRTQAAAFYAHHQPAPGQNSPIQ